MQELSKTLKVQCLTEPVGLVQNVKLRVKIVQGDKNHSMRLSLVVQVVQLSHLVSYELCPVELFRLLSLCDLLPPIKVAFLSCAVFLYLLA